MFRLRFTPLVSLLLAAGAPLALVACREQPPSPTSAQAPSPPPSASAAASSAIAAPSASVAAAMADAGPYEGPWIGATVMQAPISSEMEFPSDKPDKPGEHHAVRLGSLRYGEKAPVIPEPHKKANCPEGWYELLAGGFVCGKYTTLDLDHPRFRLVKAPDSGGRPALHLRRQRLERHAAVPPGSVARGAHQARAVARQAPQGQDRRRRQPLRHGRRDEPARWRRCRHDHRRGRRQRHAVVAEGSPGRGSARRDAGGSAGERRPRRPADGQGLLPVARPPVRLRWLDVVEDHGRPRRPGRPHLREQARHRVPRPVARPGRGDVRDEEHPLASHRQAARRLRALAARAQVVARRVPQARDAGRGPHRSLRSRRPHWRNRNAFRRRLLGDRRGLVAQGVGRHEDRARASARTSWASTKSGST